LSCHHLTMRSRIALFEWRGRQINTLACTQRLLADIDEQYWACANPILDFAQS
jgi:hypothetical protein